MKALNCAIPKLLMASACGGILCVAACGKRAEHVERNSPPQTQCSSADKKCEEEKIEETGDAAPAKGSRTPLIGAFLTSEKGSRDTVRRDEGELLLQGNDGEVVIVGTTQSKMAVDPTLSGSLFLTRFTLGQEGFSKNPTQINTLSFPAPTPEPTAGPVPAPSPTPGIPVVRAAGGRVMSDGKVLVAGSLECVGCGQASKFDMSMSNEVSSSGAAIKGFLAVFGSTSNTINQFRFGRNAGKTVIHDAVAGSVPNSLVMVGHTETGLFDDPASKPEGYISTQDLVNAHLLVEMNEQGTVKRLLPLPPPEGATTLGPQRLATNGKFLFVARVLMKGDRPSVELSSFGMPARSPVFTAIGKKSVCDQAMADAGATDPVRVTSLDASEETVVVGLEIRTANTSETTRLSCVEASQVRENGHMLAKGETVYLKELLTVAGTTRANVVKDEKILLTRTREVVDANGAGAAVSQTLFERPLKRDGFVSFLSRLSRENDGDSLNGVRRLVRQVLWPKGSRMDDVVWVLSNDDIQGTAASERPDRNEILTHLGTYPALSPETEKR